MRKKLHNFEIQFCGSYNVAGGLPVPPRRRLLGMSSLGMRIFFLHQATPLVKTFLPKTLYKKSNSPPPLFWWSVWLAFYFFVVVSDFQFVTSLKDKGTWNNYWIRYNEAAIHYLHSGNTTSAAKVGEGNRTKKIYFSNFLQTAQRNRKYAWWLWTNKCLFGAVSRVGFNCCFLTLQLVLLTEITLQVTFRVLLGI